MYPSNLTVGQSCLGNEFNQPFPNQNATFLDLDLTCIYDDFKPSLTYQLVPSPFILVEPGDRIGFYSVPANIYDIVERDGGATLSLAHNAFSDLNSFQTTFFITWPANQLELLRMNTINGTLLLSEGFTNLRQLNVTGSLGGLEAYLSTKGKISVVLRGTNSPGSHIKVMDEATELVVDIETGVGDTEVSSPNGGITGRVHAIRITDRTGNVYLDGVKSIVSTGSGPGMLFANDCSNVEGNCNPLTTNLTNPDTQCRTSDVCLVNAVTAVSPVRTCTMTANENCGSNSGDNSSNPGTGGGSSGSVHRLMTGTLARRIISTIAVAVAAFSGTACFMV